MIDRLPRPAAVLLARLLVPAGRSPPTLAKLRADVTLAVGHVSDEQWSAAVSALADAGLAVVAAPAAGRAARAAAAPLHLTDAGRTWVADRLSGLFGKAKLSPTRLKGFWQGRDHSAVDAVLLSALYAKPAAAKPLRTAVQKITGPLDEAAWSAALAAVTADGRVVGATPPPPPAKGPKPPPIDLTDRGRSAAVAWLGPVPDKATWPKVIAGQLFPATRPADQRAAASDGKRVAGLLVGDALHVGPVDNVTTAVEAAVCADLGYPHLRSVDALVLTVIGKRLGKPLPPAMSITDRNDMVTRLTLDAAKTDADALRLAAVKQWATAGEPTLPPAAVADDWATDLATFAAAVRRAAAASPTGRWGDKVFISHVHRHMPGHGPLDAFKARLVEANTEGLVRLSQADLMAALDPTDVRESQTNYLSAAFHFVST